VRRGSRLSPPATGTATLVLRDPDALHALASPVRVRLLRHLRHHGPATVGTLAAGLRLSPASASYHLGRLAEHDLIEDAAPREQRDRRQRWWRAAHSGTSVDIIGGDPAARLAAAAMAATVVRHSAAITLAYLDASERGEVAAEWRAAAALDDIGVQLTAAELARLRRSLLARLETYRGRSDPAARPPGARLVHVSLHAVPWLTP